MHRAHPRIAVIGWSALAAAALLSACDRRDDTRSAGEKVDSAAAQAERKIDNAAEATSAKAKDMAITAELKTLFARDNRLSALDINVDTSGGRVTLRGTAPDAAARDQATTLARSVSGVIDVDNQLKVK